MTRLELAKLRFRQLASVLASGVDEERSDQLETWLRSDVVPVIEDLFDNPGYRRYVLEIPRELFASPPGDRRSRINLLAEALAAEAETLVAVAREFDLQGCLADHDRAQDEAWIAAQTPPRQFDTRSVIEKLAERPWFNFVNSNDFWSPTIHLHLRNSDELLTM